MANVVAFPGSASSKLGFEPVRSTYTVRDISRRFGISEHYIRRWSREGLIPLAGSSDDGELRFDLAGLRWFGRVRDLRGQGLSLRQVDSELRGQLNLFPPQAGQVVQIPTKLSPFGEALLLHERGDARARECYRQAILDGESVADAYCNLGILEFEAGGRLPAFDCFTNALRHDPRHFEAHFNLATLYFEAGDRRLARLHFEIAGQIEAGNAHVFFNLGVVCAIEGDLESAVRALTTAKAGAGGEERREVEELLENLESLLTEKQ
jgi:DNA-binding transcriptional MerR regulator